MQRRQSLQVQNNAKKGLASHGYTVVKQIGKGSFGRALLVQRSDGKKFVVKEVNMSNMPLHEKELAQAEVKVLRTVSHPNIIKYVDHFEDGNVLSIVMEYADSGDLGNLLKEQRYPLFESEVMHYFTQLCMALKHVHDCQILHRDLKPQNIFLSKNRKLVKLGDFGIATILRGSQALAKTQCGTPYYFSPELCQHKPYNNKSDIWSLGCLLYEMLTLRRPFEATNMQSLMQAICKGKYNPLPTTCSNEVSQLVSSMLQRDPSRRPCLGNILDRPFIRAKMQAVCQASPCRQIPQPQSQQPQPQPQPQLHPQLQPQAAPNKEPKLERLNSAPVDIKHHPIIPHPPRPIPRIVRLVPTQPEGKENIKMRPDHNKNKAPEPRPLVNIDVNLPPNNLMDLNKAELIHKTRSKSEPPCPRQRSTEQTEIEESKEEEEYLQMVEIMEKIVKTPRPAVDCKKTHKRHPDRAAPLPSMQFHINGLPLQLPGISESSTLDQRVVALRSYLTSMLRADGLNKLLSYLSTTSPDTPPSSVMNQCIEIVGHQMQPMVAVAEQLLFAEAVIELNNNNNNISK